MGKTGMIAGGRKEIWDSKDCNRHSQIVNYVYQIFIFYFHVISHRDCRNPLQSAIAKNLVRSIIIIIVPHTSIHYHQRESTMQVRR